ncbi:MAG: DUF2087 domain-containing protein [candidate division WOR-3 bacterium]|nr:MAG: DUF2087 domain-containing protein [candidate division WOR-3 bacterium]
MKNKPITCEQFKKRLSDLCVRSGLSGLPRKLQDRHIIMKSVVLTLEAGEEYTEKQIDENLKLWLANIGSSIGLDHVTLRRQLVELKYLERKMDGSRYRVCPSGPGQSMFESGVENIDIYEVIHACRDSIEQKRQEYLRQRGI